MKRDEEKTGTAVDRLLARYSAPPPEPMQSSLARVGERLRIETEHSAIADGRMYETPRRRGLPVSLAFAAVAAMLVVVIAGALVRMRGPRIDDPRAIGQAIDGSLAGPNARVLRTGDRIRASEMLRSGGPTGAQIALDDGSRIEMRAESALWLERADDGVRVHLTHGQVIVNAVPQRQGHLYVQTKDVTVSVVGTVFLVKAEEEGSRVAVIEGEKRVQQGPTEQKLQPGGEMSTSPGLDSVSVSDDIVWSRQAASHLARLSQAESTPNGAPAAPRFDVVSVKPCAPGDARGAGGGTSGSSPGRLVLHCQQLWGLIQGAYVLYASGRANLAVSCRSRAPPTGRGLPSIRLRLLPTVKPALD